ncbi:hypothetical protein Tco_1002639 [Tanacetum coccineum]|uniref:Uncharacterized protein n=1 Tax=Tanacetum coccineum TaxID=301880 RepID=A0ABQ5F6T4_9ASTR
MNLAIKTISSTTQFNYYNFTEQIPTSQSKLNDDGLRVKGERMKQLVSDSSIEPVFSLAAAKWRNTDKALLSFENINLRWKNTCKEGRVGFDESEGPVP